MIRVPRKLLGPRYQKRKRARKKKARKPLKANVSVPKHRAIISTTGAVLKAQTQVNQTKLKATSKTRSTLKDTEYNPIRPPSPEQPNPKNDEASKLKIPTKVEPPRLPTPIAPLPSKPIKPPTTKPLKPAQQKLFSKSSKLRTTRNLSRHGNSPNSKKNVRSKMHVCPTAKKSVHNSSPDASDASTLNAIKIPKKSLVSKAPPFKPHRKLFKSSNSKQSRRPFSGIPTHGASAFGKQPPLSQKFINKGRDRASMGTKPIIRGLPQPSVERGSFLPKRKMHQQLIPNERGRHSISQPSHQQPERTFLVRNVHAIGNQLPINGKLFKSNDVGTVPSLGATQWRLAQVPVANPGLVPVNASNVFGGVYNVHTINHQVPFGGNFARRECPMGGSIHPGVHPASVIPRNPPQLTHNSHLQSSPSAQSHLMRVSTGLVNPTLVSEHRIRTQTSRYSPGLYIYRDPKVASNPKPQTRARQRSSSPDDMETGSASTDNEEERRKSCTQYKPRSESSESMYVLQQKDPS